MSAVKLSLVDVSSTLQPLFVRCVYTLVTVIVVDLYYSANYVYEYTVYAPVAIGWVSVETVGYRVMNLISLLYRRGAYVNNA